MKRRDFHRLSVALAAAPIGVSAIQPEHTPLRIKPPRPKPAGKWGLIAPGSPVSEERVELAIKNVEHLGFIPVLGTHAQKEYGYLAGSDEERLADLHEMFSRPEIEGIWCLRGGYGCTRLLPNINYALIAKNPKPFFGYSDITALHCAFLEHAGLVTFHGPVASAELSPFSETNFRALWEEDEVVLIPATENRTLAATDIAYQVQTLIEGVVEGALIGGNLSLLAAMAGTPFSPSYKNKIVFIEDIGEKPYRIDRMLVQLIQGTDFTEAAGYLLGVFNDCQPGEDAPSLSLHETLGQIFTPLGKPLLIGFPFGHIDHQITLPQGIRARLDTTNHSLTLLESSFS